MTSIITGLLYFRYFRYIRNILGNMDKRIPGAGTSRFVAVKYVTWLRCCQARDYNPAIRSNGNKIKTYGKQIFLSKLQYAA
jgi:hypothetical protein